jgi:diguanylate cyclase (GGDEF)-like protein/PAS domain S-box-containing protein
MNSLTLRQNLTDNLLVALLFFFTAWAGQTLAFPPFVASVVCPASGVALAATVLRGKHVWPGVLVGTFAILVKVLVIEGGVPLAAGLACSLLVGVAQAVQAYLGGVLFQRWVGDPTFGAPGVAIRYAFVAVITAIVGSTGAVAALVGFGFVQAELLPEITVWTVGRTAGMLIFTPAILLCARVRDYSVLKARRGEAVLLFVAILAVTSTVFGLSVDAQRHYPLEYVIFPGLLWALVRFGNRELGVLVALVSVIATFATAHRLGPFAIGDNPNESLMLMELYFGVMTISSLLGGAVAAQRNRAQHELEAAHHGLEARVEQRTIELRQANDALQLEMAERHLLAKAFEFSSEPALITDGELRVVSVNPAFTALTGFRAADVRGQDLASLAANNTDRAERGRYEQLLTQLDQKDEAKGEISCRRHNEGAAIPARMSLAVVRDGNGRATQHIVSLTDLTEQKAAEQRTAFLAHHDPLTGLPNRAWLTDILDRTIAYAQRRRLRFGVLFADLDQFKPINDQYGHAVGDQLLKAVVERLSAGIRAEDTIARLGGDEFLIVLPDLREGADAKRVAGWVVEQLAKPFHIDGLELKISSSVGISLYPDHAQSATELIACADSAMYYAKEHGRNAFHSYAPELGAAAPAPSPQRPAEKPEALASGFGLAC